MDLSAITGVSSATPPETGIAGGALGKDEFLQLLATQMSNQDPLNPADSSDMIAQLAQFSSLEQMQNLNTQFTASQRDSALLMGLSLSGQDVKLTLNDGSEVQGTVSNVIWDSTKQESGILMDNVLYSMSDILAMAAVTEEETATPAAADTAEEPSTTDALTEAVVGA